MDPSMSGMSGMSGNSSMSSSNDTMGSDMSGMMGGSCKINMLLNFYTIDACFLSEHWQIGSAAGFAGTFFAVFFISASVEGIRRLQREYDRRLTASLRKPTLSSSSDTSSNASDKVAVLNGEMGTALPKPILPNMREQLLRSTLSGTAFMTAFWIMLIGMYYNAYLLIAIFLGNAFGYFVFARDTLNIEVEQPVSACGC